MTECGHLPRRLYEQLQCLVPSRDGELSYFPCLVTLKDGSQLDRVYVMQFEPYIKSWGIRPEDDSAKKSIPIESVASISESPSRLPVQFANQLYRAGESGMGYCVFTVVFQNGSARKYVTGNAVDFLAYPFGLGPRDVIAVQPHTHPWMPNKAPTTSGASTIRSQLPPNMPFQRTRVARFARSGSPLNGRPLGGNRRPADWIAMLGLIVTSAACVAVGGRLRPDWKSTVDIDRRPRPSAESPLQPLMLVVVRDLNNQPLPGVTVALASDAGPYPLKFQTELDGTARPTVGPGEWQVTLSLPGFKPLHHPVIVNSGERCVITAYLCLEPGYGVTVAENRLKAAA